MTNNPLRSEYIARINRVLDYIDKNLSTELSLKTLSDLANFSPYHFHRIFSSIVGEPLNKFISRIRIEKAAILLIDNPYSPITDIALDLGFSSSAVFSRSFKDYFGITPSEWREQKSNSDSKNCIMNSKMDKSNSKIDKSNSNTRKEFDNYFKYFRNVKITLVKQNEWILEMQTTKQLTANVEVKDMPAMSVAYIRHIGPYAGNEELFGNLFGKLFRWAGARNLIGKDTQCITVYHDNPDLTDENKLRISVCLTVPVDTQIDGEIGKMEIPTGRYALAKFEISPDQYGDAWQAVYGGWLPESGYQPDDRPCFEIYHNDPNQHPEHKHIVSICVAVKPL